jgi:N-acetylmuramoyl-L-alanine amidase
MQSVNRISRWLSAICVGMGVGISVGIGVAGSVQAESPLRLVYPQNNHQTTADRIFLIGTADPNTDVTLNGQTVGDRSRAGHFAPTVPLQLGENTLVLRSGGQEIRLQVQRLSNQVKPPLGMAFAEDSLTPAVDLARLPQEPICFQAIAPPQAQVSVQLGTLQLPLQPDALSTHLPDNAAVLTGDASPQTNQNSGLFQGCTALDRPGDWGNPRYRLSLKGKTLEQRAPGRIRILNPATFTTVEVIRPGGGTARTGPSTDDSRLTPLPLGAWATVNGKTGEWLRLDYGGWIRESETRVVSSVPLQSMIRSLHSRQGSGWTEVIFPLQKPVPLTVDQGEKTFTLTLYNTTAQTDVIALNDDPVIQRLDWQQVVPGQIQYRFNLKSRRQWGYKLRYQGSTLILSLRHPPLLPRQGPPLQGLTILLDPGHGGPQDLGSRGPTAYPEKAVSLQLSQLLEKALIQRGAKVVLTRSADLDLDLQPRIDLINATEPAIAISLHYNALPDNGNALGTQGIGAFWYQPQSHDLAVFMHNFLVSRLHRRSYGVFWNNLALTRPTVAPAILLELGFMINPQEFEWITDPKAQQQLAKSLAEGITAWFHSP